MADTDKKIEEAKIALENVSSAISQFIKNVDLTSDAFDGMSDTAKSFAKNISDAMTGRNALDADTIAKTLVGQLQDQLENEGKNITIPNLIKQLSKAGVGEKVTNAISEWAKQRNQYVIGVKNLAEELSKQLIKPFEYMTDWIEKIPGGKILEKMFGFDTIKKKIQQDITEKLAESVLKGASGFEMLKGIGTSTFKSIGGAVRAAFAHPILLAIALIVGALYVAYKQWNKIIDAAKSLRDETGLTGKMSKDISDLTAKIAADYTSMGVNMETVAKSNAALVNEFQTTSALTEDMYKNSALMVGALGVAPDVAAKTLRVFKNMGINTGQATTNMIGLVSEASKLAGVAPSAIFKDLAESSKEIYTYFKGNVINAAKAAIELRRMGTSLKEAANTSKNLLDFESSITSELEASVLAGRQLDFSRARYLSFTGDLKGSQEAILDQIQKINNFENMNIIQKEAIAKASGMELDQLQNMLEQRKQINKMNWRDKQAYEDSLKALNEFREGNKLNLIQENQRLLAQEKMAAGWDNLIMKLSQIVFPIFDAIYNIVDEIGNAIQNMFAGDAGKKTLEELQSGFKEIGKVIAEIIPPLVEIMKVILPILIDYVKAFLEPLKVGLKMVSALLKGDFAGALNMIGDLFGSLWKRILTGLTLPFQLALGFIDKIFGTNIRRIFTNIISWISNAIGKIIEIIVSPIKIAVNLFTGLYTFIVGIFSSMIDTISAPFIEAVSFIKNAFEDLGKFLTGWWDKIYGAVIQPLVDTWDYIFGSDEEKEINVNVNDKSKEIVNDKNKENVNDRNTEIVAPPTADGGIVKTTQVRTVGEAGPEAIIPLNDNILDGLFGKSSFLGEIGELFNKPKEEVKIDNSDVVKKLDELIVVMKSLEVKMDGKKVGELIANSTPQLGRA